MDYLDYSLKDFTGELASKQPTPGGGSSAAVNGALAASLLLMVIRVTKNSPDLESLEDLLQGRLKRALEFIDEDAESFNQVMEAFRMPQSSEEERKKRQNAIQKALQEAASTPLELLELTLEVAEQAVEIAKKGNDNAITDAAAGAISARAAADTAFYNVMINLESIEDEKFVEKVGGKAYRLKQKAARIENDVINLTEDKIEILGREW